MWRPMKRYVTKPEISTTTNSSNPICDPIVDDPIVNWDRIHLTAGFAKTLAPPIDNYLEQIGLIGP
jgi:hypothetical protein